MEKTLVNKQREYWIDNVKLVACILVVVGHFFQSMANANIIERNEVYNWFMKMIYCFHVPLFFICSGYLYQKYSIVNSISTWKNNVLKKLLGLGVPYFTFSIITYLMKEVFSSSVNSQNGEFVCSLFWEPVAPYWYLYALFFLFFITPTLGSKINIYLVSGIAVTMKIISIACVNQLDVPKIVKYIFSYEVWFVLGMVVGAKGTACFRRRCKNKNVVMSVIGMSVFVALTVFMYTFRILNEYFEFVCGLLACFALISFFINVTTNPRIAELVSKYTMSIYVMHTIFAAGVRSILIKIGITNVLIHIFAGLFASFAGPIVAAWIMEKTKYLEFFIAPGKFIKMKK